MEHYIPKVMLIRIYLGREMGRRALISCEVCIRMEGNNLGWYVRNSNEPLIEEVKATEITEYNNTANKKQFTQSWMRKRKNYGKTKECMDSLQEKCQKQKMKK